MHKTTVASLGRNAKGIVERVARTERPALIVDDEGFPVAAVVPLNASEIELLAMEQSPASFNAMDPIDTGIVSVVARLPGELSTVRPAHILHGSQGPATLADGHDMLPEYGLFAAEDHAMLKQRTHDLVENGTLTRDEDGKLDLGKVDRAALLGWLARPRTGQAG